MGMNAPGGAGQDKAVVNVVSVADIASAEKAGKDIAAAYGKGAASVSSGMQGGVPPMPGGAPRPGPGAYAGSIYGGTPQEQEDRWRGSGRRGPPAGERDTVRGPGDSTVAPPIPDEEDDGRVYSRRPGDIRRFRVRRITASDAERQQALAQEETAKQDAIRDREDRQAALRQRRRDIQRGREQRLDDRRASGQAGVDEGLRADVIRQARGGMDADERMAAEIAARTVAERQAAVREARGAGAAARRESVRVQREADRAQRDVEAARQEVIRRYNGANPTDPSVLTPQQRDDQMAQQIGQRTQRERDQRNLEAQRVQDFNRRAAERMDAAGADAIRRREIQQAGGPGGILGRRNLAGQDALQGGLGPTATGLSYGFSALGNAILLAAPFANVAFGGGFGDLPIVGGAFQGDIQTTRRLNQQQNQERLRIANIQYGRSMYGAQVQEEQLGIQRGREGLQYQLQRQDIERGGTREAADYARSTVQLQREALVHQRDYARNSEDLERRRLITERSYARQVEDTSRARFVADRNYARQVEDTGRQRFLAERGFTRQYEDLARQRHEVEVRFTRQYEDLARQRRDVEITVSRQREDLSRSFVDSTIRYTRQQQDFARDRNVLGIGYGRQQQDTAIQSGRADEDFRRERGRAQIAIQDTIKLREIESRTNLRDQRLRLQDIGASQFQAVGGLLGAAQSGDPFAIVGAAYRMRQLRQERAIVQGNVNRGGFTEAERFQQGVQDRQAQFGLQDIDRQHARAQQDIGIQQRRNTEDYLRGLKEIGIQETRANEDRKRELQVFAIQETRIREDEQRELAVLDTQVKRTREDEKFQLEGLAIQEARIGEDRAAQLQAIDIQQKRFFEDYQTNLQTIAIEEQRHWEDYAENIRQIALLEVRMVQDRVTQMQQEAMARSQLDVAHARTIQDLGIQQMKADIAHAQSLEDFEIQQKAIDVSRKQASEDLENSRIAVQREAETQTIALNREMRSLWVQLAVAVGLFGIFSAQFFSAVTYLAGFFGLARGGAAAAAAATAGPAPGAAAGAAGITGLIAGISLAPEVLRQFDEWMKTQVPNYAPQFGNITGATTAQASEIGTTPGGQNIDTGAGASNPNLTGMTAEEQAWYGRSGGVPPNPYGSGVQTGPVRDDWRTRPGTSAALAGSLPQYGGPLGESTVSVSATDKIKQNYEGMVDLSDDITKRFDEAYGKADLIKTAIGQGSDYGIQIKNSMSEAAGYSPAIMNASANMANAAAYAAKAMADAAVVTQQVMASMGGNTADKTSFGTLGSGSQQRSSNMIIPNIRARLNPRRGDIPYVIPTYGGSSQQPTPQQQQDPYVATPYQPSMTGNPTPPAEEEKQKINAHAYKMEYRSSFYKNTGAAQSFSEHHVNARSSENQAPSSGDFKSLTNAITGLVQTMNKGGTAAVSSADVNRKISEVMTNWVKSGMLG